MEASSCDSKCEGSCELPVPRGGDEVGRRLSTCVDGVGEIEYGVCGLGLGVAPALSSSSLPAEWSAETSPNSASQTTRMSDTAMLLGISSSMGGGVGERGSVDAGV